MRHGKPAFTGGKKVTSEAMASWIKHYDLADIGSDSPSEASRKLAAKALVVFSSPLPRAISSLAALNLTPKKVVEVFREAELPVYLIPVVKLSPFSWVLFFRLLWLCGMSHKAESLALAKGRARQGADLLEKYARERSGPVLMMGHGIINRLIAQQLIARGWTARARAGKGYWGADVFQFP